jgi:hypothetical protein
MPSRIAPNERGTLNVWSAFVWRLFNAITAGLSPSGRTSARWSTAIVTPSSGANAPPAVPIHPCATAIDA